MRKIVYGLLGFNAVLFVGGLVMIAITLVAYQPWVSAQTATSQATDAAATQTATTPTSSGMGIGLLGAAMATAGSSLGAGVALSGVGAAAIGAVTEKPSMFGLSLVYVGLAEGIAIYGIVISIMILGRL